MLGSVRETRGRGGGRGGMRLNVTMTTRRWWANMYLHTQHRMSMLSKLLLGPPPGVQGSCGAVARPAYVLALCWHETLTHHPGCCSVGCRWRPPGIFCDSHTNIWRLGNSSTVLFVVRLVCVCVWCQGGAKGPGEGCQVSCVGVCVCVCTAQRGCIVYSIDGSNG